MLSYTCNSYGNDTEFVVPEQDMENADIVLITLYHRKQKDTGSRRDNGSSWTKGLRARDLRTAKELTTLSQLQLSSSHCLNTCGGAVFCFVGFSEDSRVI